MNVKYRWDVSGLEIYMATRWTPAALRAGRGKLLCHAVAINSDEKRQLDFDILCRHLVLVSVALSIYCTSIILHRILSAARTLIPYWRRSVWQRLGCWVTRSQWSMKKKVRLPRHLVVVSDGLRYLCLLVKWCSPPLSIDRNRLLCRALFNGEWHKNLNSRPPKKKSDTPLGNDHYQSPKRRYETWNSQ
jgi:hypothetical protein